MNALRMIVGYIAMLIIVPVSGVIATGIQLFKFILDLVIRGGNRICDWANI